MVKLMYWLLRDGEISVWEDELGQFWKVEMVRDGRITGSLYGTPSEVYNAFRWFADHAPEHIRADQSPRPHRVGDP